MSARDGSLSSAIKGGLTGVTAGAVLVGLAASPVSAADQGDWGSPCSNRSSACAYEGDVGSYYQSDSNQRDSDFDGDGYRGAPANHPINDHVHYFHNNFSTVSIQFFRNRDYNNDGRGVTSCFAGGSTVGGYATGNADGLSSFKSC